MSYYKSMVKTIIFTGLLLGNSLFANHFLVSDEKEIDYSLIESHLIYGIESDDKKLDSLDIKTTTKNYFDEMIPPLYEGKKMLFRVSTKGIREEQKELNKTDTLDFTDKSNNEITSDSLISFVMKLTF